MRNHLLISIGLMVLSLLLSVIFGYFSMMYAAILYTLLLILLFIFNGISFHLICITINFIVFGTYCLFDKFENVFANLGIFLVICTIYHLLLIKGICCDRVLKTVYGYPDFNLLLISAEMQKAEDRISQSIETALENQLLANEVKSANRKPTQKVLRVFNCVFAAMGIVSVLMINYSLILESGIVDAENFTVATEGKNVYIKGEITGNVIQAALGQKGEYWIFVRGQYVYVMATEKATERLNALCDEDVSNDNPVEFVGKYVIYSQDANDAVLYKKDDDSDVIADEKYMIKMLNGNEYVILNKLGYGMLIVVVVYGLVSIIYSIIKTKWVSVCGKAYR